MGKVVINEEKLGRIISEAVKRTLNEFFTYQPKTYNTFKRSSGYIATAFEKLCRQCNMKCDMICNGVLCVECRKWCSGEKKGTYAGRIYGFKERIARAEKIGLLSKIWEGERGHGYTYWIAYYIINFDYNGELLSKEEIDRRLAVAKEVINRKDRVGYNPEAEMVARDNYPSKEDGPLEKEKRYGTRHGIVTYKPNGEIEKEW